MARHNQRNAWADGNRQWGTELAAVLAAHGLPWQASSCWCDQRTGLRCAELIHQATRSQHTIAVSTADAATPALRRAEIVRQLRGV